MTDPRSVRNVIFDFGGVLVNWQPEAIIAGFYAEPALRDAIRRHAFQHDDWLEMDRGTLDEPTVSLEGSNPLCGDRITQYTFFSVGSGTGPATRAPVRVTVSTIFRAELSMTSWSYALSLMRIFCPAMWLPTAFQKHCLRFVCRNVCARGLGVPADAFSDGGDSPRF